MCKLVTAEVAPALYAVMHFVNIIEYINFNVLYHFVKERLASSDDYRSKCGGTSDCP